MAFEFEFLNFIQANMRCSFLDTVMPVISNIANGGYIWMILCAVLIVFKPTRKAGIAAAIALALEALCCNVILKPLVARVRPFAVNTSVSLLIPAPTDFSFPSGHTGAALAVSSALSNNLSKLGLPTTIFAVLVAFSRLYLYVHYPSDVLVGFILGMFTGWIGTIITDKIYFKFKMREKTKISQ